MLPKKIIFRFHDLELNAITKADKSFYCGIYSNRALMEFINSVIDKEKILENFVMLIDEIKKNNPTYVSYTINSEKNKIGILGIKILNTNDLEIGVIIKQKFQRLDWSRKIKLMLIEYLNKNFGIKRIVTYCKHDNAAVNHINLSIGFILSKQFKHKTKGQLINKWVLISPHKKLEE